MKLCNLGYDFVFEALERKFYEKMKTTNSRIGNFPIVVCASWVKFYLV